MNPHEEFITDEVSGIEVKNQRYLDYQQGAEEERERIAGGQHYLRRCDWTGKYLELAGQRRRKHYLATCACGFRAEAYSRHLAECKIYGHQETMQALKEA